jgi:hypothetical protein
VESEDAAHFHALAGGSIDAVVSVTENRGAIAGR